MFGVEGTEEHVTFFLFQSFRLDEVAPLLVDKKKRYLSGVKVNCLAGYTRTSFPLFLSTCIKTKPPEIDVEFTPRRAAKTASAIHKVNTRERLFCIVENF